jgi:membrane protein implicated in regulation of membrane protease activity
MIPWWSWAILAALLGLAEMHAPGGYLIWIALGAALTAGVDAVYHLSITAQVVIMMLASCVSCVAGYFVYRHADRRQPDTATLNQRDALLVGERGVVCSDIVHGEGKVRLGDTVWLAEGPNLPTGTAIIVKSVHRARVRVRPVDAAFGRASHSEAP